MDIYDESGVMVARSAYPIECERRPQRLPDIETSGGVTRDMARKVTPNAEGLWGYRDVEIAFYAFRYGLGRVSYAVGTIAGYIRDNWHRLDEKHRRLICQEIREAMDRDGAGMKCDIAEWQAVLDMADREPAIAAQEEPIE